MMNQDKNSPCILHLITSLELGGAESMLLKLLSSPSLPMRHVVVSLKPLENTALYPAFQRQKIECLSLNLKGPFSFFSAFIKLCVLILKVRPKLIQTWLYHSDALGALASLFTRRPVIWNVRCSNVDIMLKTFSKKILIKFLALLSSRVRLCIANSQAGIKYHKETLHFKCREWKYLPNGFATNKFKKDSQLRADTRRFLNIAENDFVIGLVGRYDPFKDIPTFAKAAQIFMEKDPGRTTFILIGPDMDANNTELVEILNEHQVLENFILLGQRNDLTGFYNAFDLFTLTSKSEGFPNVVGEAMACELPIVATDAGDVKEIVGDCGIITAVGDAKAIASGWQELKEQDRLSLGIKCRNSILSRFNIEMIQKEYFEIYKKIN